MTSGGAPIPVGWPWATPRCESASRLPPQAQMRSQARVQVWVAGQGWPLKAMQALSPSPRPPPLRPPRHAWAHLLPSPMSASKSQVSFAGLDALQAEIQARERELMESRKRQEEAEGAMKEREGKWEAEVEGVRAQLAAVSKTKEETGGTAGSQGAGDTAARGPAQRPAWPAG